MATGNIVAGILSQGLGLNATTDLVKKSFSSMITRLMPNGSAPLFGLTSMLKDEVAVQTEHGFFTKTMIFPSVTASGTGELIGATTFTNMVSTAQLIPGMILLNPLTRELILVNTVVSGDCSGAFHSSVN